MLGIAPVGCIFKSGLEACLILIVLNAAAAMVEVQVGKEHVRNVIRAEACFLQRSFERICSVEVIMAVELCILLAADAVIDQDEAVAVFDEEAAHGPVAEVVLISRVGLVPQ